MGSSFFLSELSSWPYHSHYHYPLNLLQIVVLSSHQHQGTEPPSLAQQSGLSTQSCQKTSTNDTKVREKLCDLSLYLSTYRPIQKRLWECNSSSQVWSGRGGIHPVFTNIEQHRAKVLFFAYLYTSCNFDIYCWLRSPCPTFAATSRTKTSTYAAGISPKASLAFSGRWGIKPIIIMKKEPQQENHLQGGSGQRVAFLCPPGVTHVLATWACWLSGQVQASRHYSVTVFLFDFQ